MKDYLIDTLEPLGYPIIRQGSMTEEEDYPQSFFTYWQNDSFGNSHYDDSSNNIVWDFDVNFYSADPELVDNVLGQAIKLLEAADFIPVGNGHDVGSDEVTHTGRGINVLKIEI